LGEGTTITIYLPTTPKNLPDETQRLGAGAYVKKPYTIEQVGLAVKNELSR
jgi:hypothetical protein